MNPLFAFGAELLSPWHLLIILGVGLLIFGKRLPEVGRSLGKGIVEFKKGLKGIEDEVDVTTTTRQEPSAAIEPPRPPQRVATNAPKFEEQPHTNPPSPQT